MNIIMLPFHDYKKWQEEGFRTRDAHICEHFLKDDRVDKILVINRPTSIAEVILKRKAWYTHNGKIEYKKQSVQLSRMSEKVWCLDVFLNDFLKVLIERKMWWFTAFNYKNVIDEIDEAIKYLNIENNILLLQNPMAVGAAQNLKSNKFVFDAIDNWIYHPQMKNKDIIKQNYDYIDKNADLILTVSKDLKYIFSTNKNVHWVPNGVNINYFKDALKEIESNKKVIGYVGKIQDRVDFDLVEKCLIKFPKNKFIFIGPIYTQKDKVKMLKRKYPNIVFKGDIHYNKLPEHMREFDITIIPHHIDKFTQSMNPLKLYEYLAAGKPVISTGVAGTASISEFVYISKDFEDFVIKLEEIIKEFNTLDINSIVSSLPDECKWENRVDRIIKLMKSL